MKDTFLVNEIFNSIDGEGIRTGALATFIRLSGCNMRCSYCDTEYALSKDSGKIMSIDDILNEVSKYNCKHITLTGGEPLMYKNCINLINKLSTEGYFINIETNGSYEITPYLLKNCIITMDYKTPSSKMMHKMDFNNIERLRSEDVLKFVCDEDDLPLIEEVLMSYDIKSYIYISPILGKIEPSKLVDFLKNISEKIDTDKIRIQVQLHKIIWNPEERGV